jgi:protein-tyrosine phosphatase
MTPPTALADPGATALTDPGTGAPVQPPCEVLPGLWQSGLPEDWAALRDRVDAVVDVADAGTGPSEDELGGLTYVKAPLQDGEELPDPVVLDHLTGLVADLVRDGRRVLVHCTFGKNRSGLLMALVVRELLGCDGRTALQRVRAVRHRAVNNERFARWVSELPAPR